jgi:hypothetical protein
MPLVNKIYLKENISFSVLEPPNVKIKNIANKKPSFLAVTVSEK